MIFLKSYLLFMKGQEWTVVALRLFTVTNIVQLSLHVVQPNREVLETSVATRIVCVCSSLRRRGYVVSFLGFIPILPTQIIRCNDRLKWQVILQQCLLTSGDDVLIVDQVIVVLSIDAVTDIHGDDRDCYDERSRYWWSLWIPVSLFFPCMALEFGSWSRCLWQ